MRYFSFDSLGVQTTIKKCFEIEGKAMVSGKKVTVKCTPAKADVGIVFIVNGSIVKAIYSNLAQGNFHTTVLEESGNKIMTVEHILSAFYSLGIDNVVIDVNGDFQLPLLDSSSNDYAREIIKADITRYREKRKIIRVLRSCLILDDNTDSFALFLPSKSIKEESIEVIIDFPNIVGCQRYAIDLCSRKDYYKNISFARSFFIEPYEPWRWKVFRKQFKLLPKDINLSPIIAYDNQKFISKLKYKDEPVRHKILDFLGDLSLLGYRISGEIMMYKPGHRFTHNVVRKVAKMIKEGEADQESNLLDFTKEFLSKV